PNWKLMKQFKTADLPEVTPESRREIDNAAASYAIGMTYLGRNVLPDALAWFLRAVERDPAHNQARLEAARLSLRLDRPSAGLALARDLSTRDPRNAEALLVAGRAALALNMPRDAVALLQKAAELKPENEEIKRALSKALLGG